MESSISSGLLERAIDQKTRIDIVELEINIQRIQNRLVYDRTLTQSKKDALRLDQQEMEIMLNQIRKEVENEL